MPLSFQQNKILSRRAGVGEERKTNFDSTMVERWLHHRAEKEDCGISLFNTRLGHRQAVTLHEMLCLSALVSLPVKTA